MLNSDVQQRTPSLMLTMIHRINGDRILKLNLAVNF